MNTDTNSRVHGALQALAARHANFTYVLPAAELPVAKLSQSSEGWVAVSSGTLKVEKKHQLANFADFCNECGNCDVFCPEDGGPYAIKPRFFGTVADWRKLSHLDGFALERSAGGWTLHGRIGADGRRRTASSPSITSMS